MLDMILLNFQFLSYVSIEVIIFWIVGFFLVMYVGTCLVSVCKLEKYAELKYMAGCIFFVAIPHFVYSIAEPMQGTFRSFKIVSVVIMIGTLIVLSLCWLKKERGEIGSNEKKLIDYSRLEKCLLVVILCFVFYVLINSLNRLYMGSDDGFYITKVGMMLRDNMLHITNSQAGNGIIDDPTYVRADASSWCGFFALIASSFHIDYAVVAHVAIVPFILSAFFATISLIAKTCFKKTSSRMFFWIVFVSFALTAPYSRTMTTDYWIFSYAWYGISALYILIYFYIYCFLIAYKNTEYANNRNFWIFMSLAFAAGIATEVVSVYVIPCLILMFGVPYLIKNRQAWSVRFFVSVLLSVLPVIYGALWLLLQYVGLTDLSLNAGENGGVDMSLTSLQAWKANQLEYWSFSAKNIYTVMTVLCLLFIRNKKIKKFFGYSSLIAVLTFLNPFFYKFVCANISTQMTYYRLYWCIPNLIIITYFIIEKYEDIKIPSVGRTLVLLAIVVSLFVYRPCVYSDFDIATNEKKLSTEIVTLAEDLLAMRETENDTICVVVPPSVVYWVRQYSLDILYSVSTRSATVTLAPNSDKAYRSLYNVIYKKGQADAGLSEADVETLKLLGTEVVVYEEGTEVPNVLNKYDMIGKNGYIYVHLND